MATSNVIPFRRPGSAVSQRWPALGRKGCREAQKQLRIAMKKAADVGHRTAFDMAFAASQELKYPSTVFQFLKMFNRAMRDCQKAKEAGLGMDGVA